MKRKTFFISITISSLIAIFLLLYFGSEIFNCVYCTDHFDVEADIKKGDIHLIEFGLPIYPEWEKSNQVAKIYGFQFENYGCLVEDRTVKCANFYNKKIIEYLSERNGKDWYKRFEKSLDSLKSAAE